MDPEIRQALAELADVKRRMAELERVWAAGDADRQISVADFARSINRAPSTVLSWWRNDHDRAKWHLTEVIQRDLAGRLFTTPRLVSKWKHATAARLVPTRIEPPAAIRGNSRQRPGSRRQEEGNRC